MTKSPPLKRPAESDVQMAIAIEGRPNPLEDPEMSEVSPDPGSLDLPDSLDSRQAPAAGAARRRSVLESCYGSRFQPGRRRVHGSGAAEWCKSSCEFFGHPCGAIGMMS